MAVGLGRHHDRAEVARPRLVGIGSDPVREVLHQVAAQRHVQHLEAAAHGEDGKGAVQDAAQQLELEPIALGRSCPPCVAAVLAVAVGADVASTDQHQTVERVADDVEVGVGLRPGRDEHRLPTGRPTTSR